MKKVNMRFSSEEWKIITSFLKKAATKRRRDPRMRVMGFPEFLREASLEERVLLKKFLKLDPRIYGFKGEYYGVTAPPKGLVTIRRERTSKTKKYFSGGIHFLPRRVFDAYQKMNRAMLRGVGRRVFVLSGYRSPAYQLVIFLETLQEHKFNIENTASRVALPGYSEHGAPKRQAIDFTTCELGEKGSDNTAFERTKEYQWLMKHAGEFGFRLSYPRGNKWGVMFEPWHWYYSATVHGKGSRKL